MKTLGHINLERSVPLQMIMKKEPDLSVSYDLNTDNTKRWGTK